MSRAIRTLKWAWRAWPVLVSAAVVMAHLTFLDLLPSYAHAINATVALVLQVVGGLLVLYSIDSNIGVIRGNSLFAELRRYLLEFPLIRKSYVLEVQGAKYAVSGGKARLSVTRNPRTTEERLDYLQEQINEIRRDLQEDISELRSKFQKRNSEVDEKIGSLGKSVKQIESQVAEVAVGGVKIQIFGILLLGHGAIAGYVA